MTTMSQWLPNDHQQMLSDGSLNILLIIHRLRDEALPIFLKNVRLRIRPAMWRSLTPGDIFTGFQNIAIGGDEVSASYHTFKDRFWRLRSLYIYYTPKTLTNIRSLEDFVTCKGLCCGELFRPFLLNMLFHREKKDDDCWISAFKGRENKINLQAEFNFEIKIIMSMKISTKGEDHTNKMVDASHAQLYGSAG